MAVRFRIFSPRVSIRPPKVSRHTIIRLVPSCAGRRATRGFATSESKKAIRVLNRQATVSRWMKGAEQAKTGVLYLAAGTATVIVLVLGGYLVREKFSGSSKYSVFDAAIKKIEANEEAVEMFGKMRFFGERGGDRGRHTGLRNNSFVNPRTGISHSQVWFSLQSVDKSKRGKVYAEMCKEKKMFFDSWEMRELTIEYPVSRSGRQTKKLVIVAKDKSAGKEKTPKHRHIVKEFIKV